MLLINKEKDLGKSFEKLKEMLKLSYDKSQEGRPGCHAHAFGILESAVKIHLIACTDTDMEQLQNYLVPDKDPDDLKHVAI